MAVGFGPDVEGDGRGEQRSSETVSFLRNATLPLGTRLQTSRSRSPSPSTSAATRSSGPEPAPTEPTSTKLPPPVPRSTDTSLAHGTGDGQVLDRVPDRSRRPRSRSASLAHRPRNAERTMNDPAPLLRRIDTVESGLLATARSRSMSPSRSTATAATGCGAHRVAHRRAEGRGAGGPGDQDRDRVRPAAGHRQVGPPVCVRVHRHDRLRAHEHGVVRGGLESARAVVEEQVHRLVPRVRGHDVGPRAVVDRENRDAVRVASHPRASARARSRPCRRS